MHKVLLIIACLIISKIIKLLFIGAGAFLSSAFEDTLFMHDSKSMIRVVQIIGCILLIAASVLAIKYDATKDVYPGAIVCIYLQAKHLFIIFNKIAR